MPEARARRQQHVLWRRQDHELAAGVLRLGDRPMLLQRLCKRRPFLPHAFAGPVMGCSHGREATCSLAARSPPRS